MTPIHDNVIVKVLDNDAMTKSGILLCHAEKRAKKWNMGEVVVTHPGSQVKPGDRIIFNRFDPFDFTYEGVKYSKVTEKEILAVIEEM